MRELSVEHAGPRWVVYAAFDAAGRSSPHVIEQLAAYRQLGFYTLVVDTSPSISNQRADDWRLSATDWFHRPNVGYDFASYRSGLENLVEKRQVSVQDLSLILANDSCFGPFLPIRQVFHRLDAIPRDGKTVFAITDSHEGHHHLQSYWLYFRPDVVRLALAFLRDMRIASDRGEAIEYGELGMAAYLRERGCELRAYCSVLGLLARYAPARGRLASLLELGIRRLLKRPLYNRKSDGACLKYLLGRPDATSDFNPSLGFGAQMYRGRLTPFVKKQLMRDNPYGDPAIPRGLDVSTLTNADVAHILNRSQR